MENKGEIIKIRKETHDVSTLIVRTDKKIEFIPGQYCLVSIPDNIDSRPFTFANEPGSENIEFTIKRIGEFTKALHELEEGDKIGFSEPKGSSLNFDKSIKKDVVFIAGGSGITPFISSLRYAAENGLENNFLLIFSNRTNQDIIFRNELKNMDKNNQNIKVINTLTKEIPDNWKQEKGYIDKEMINDYVSDINKKLFFFCGPPPMVDAMIKLLREIGVSDEDMRWEQWQIPGKHNNKN
ncbi:hypothetical protein GF327_04510 [Candidatus Woesearchaeota archaeon]|nr:hypothetical protein [Candidatus Woesearchaeota archaeon]